ncbi:SIR2 family protein [Acinetobacter baumannii]|nr:SIR2 family protein [Acinetobacter baumannii]EHU2058933.1 SIR2 family protein [Acinetobacter baumannii]EHU2067333.1 SIR2 family protein [Acinetobacter baumannii]EHU2120332.1 SIR2 family protein [Acinetobacter baumannii]EHU3201125.1 SIR2 family protein [Acinetobacter baumannii]
MNYENALIAARNGNAIIFMGAGFSYGLKSATGKSLPNGRKLAHILSEEINAKTTDDLRIASKRYLKSKNENDLISLLKNYFYINKVDSSYDDITKIPWRAIYTTNYDNSFEVSALSNGLKYESIDIEGMPRETANRKRVIHINGFIDQVSPENLHTSFKLTNTSYLTEQFRNSPWSEVFKRDIKSAHAIFFVGYSLYDIDIQEIIYADKELKRKTFFIERSDLTSEEIEDSELNDFGEIKNIGVIKFAEDLKNVDPLAIQDKEEFILTSFEKMKFNQSFDNVNDSEIFNLLLKGELNEGKLYNDLIAEKERYSIVRHDFQSIIDGLSKKENLIIFGGLANGKSIYTKQIAINFYNNGYSIFELNDDYLQSYAFKEIETIIKRFPKSLFIIESYTENLEIVSHINNNRNIDTKIILVSRTHEHERTENELYYSRKIIEVNKTIELQVDKLSDQDIGKIVDFFDLYGLWGEKFSSSRDHKMKYLSTNASREFHGILLGLLDSPQVKQKLSNFFEEMAKSRTLMTHVVAVLCLAITNISKPNFHIVAAITNSSSIFESSLRKNPVFKQLINSSDGALLVRSSVLAEYILTKFPNSILLVNTVVEIAKNARSKADGNELYFKFYKDLASFRYIQKILPEKGKREALILFYQGLRDIPQERKNPHFWLQYAIARLSYPDKDNLQNAKHHLDVAMSLAKARPNYWTDDIETQYARYYLENAINSYDKVQVLLAITDFEDAINLIFKVHAGNRHKKELFRPIILVENFYNKFKTVLSPEKIYDIELKCERLISLFEKDAPKYDRDIKFRLAFQSINNVLTSIKSFKHLQENK